ncbi:hypothetical protein [Blastococcus sp. SYSU DS0973]
MSGGDEERFLELVIVDPTLRAVLDRVLALGMADRWLEKAPAPTGRKLPAGRAPRRSPRGVVVRVGASAGA